MGEAELDVLEIRERAGESWHHPAHAAGGGYQPQPDFGAVLVLLLHRIQVLVYPAELPALEPPP